MIHQRHRQTDRRTGDMHRKTALCTIVHRAVKTKCNRPAGEWRWFSPLPNSSFCNQTTLQHFSGHGRSIGPVSVCGCVCLRTRLERNNHWPRYFALGCRLILQTLCRPTIKFEGQVQSHCASKAMLDNRLRYMPVQRMKVVSVKHILPPTLTGYYSNVSLETADVRFVIHTNRSIKSENLVKIGLVLSEILAEKAILPIDSKISLSIFVILGLLDQMSSNLYTNLHTTYRNHLHLIFLNRKCDPAIRFGTPLRWLKVG